MFSVSEVKKLPIGTKLRLVRCLVGEVSPEKQDREVVGRKSWGLEMKKPDGTVSELRFCKGDRVQRTDDGFRVVNGENVQAEYVTVHVPI